MNSLELVFKNSSAFIPFITAGDPTMETTEQLVLKLADAGADLIELGIPFSDPVAEGPVIQAASSRALAAGATTDKIFAMVKSLRKKSRVPLAFMTYINPIFIYGAERFMKYCQELDVCAVIVPDLPYEERGELLPDCRKHGIHLISMIAPTSKGRIHRIVSEAQGFIYCVSSMGVTGVRQEVSSDVREMIETAKETANIPCAVGFGISAPEQAEEMIQFSDGVIVGSAIVKIIEQYGVKCEQPVIEYVRAMRRAVKRKENL